MTRKLSATAGADQRPTSVDPCRDAERWLHERIDQRSWTNGTVRQIGVAVGASRERTRLGVRRQTVRWQRPQPFGRW